MTTEPLASPKELADYLGGAISVQTLYTWRKTGTGPKVMKVGRHLRYRPSDVEAWLAEQEQDERLPHDAA